MALFLTPEPNAKEMEVITEIEKLKLKLGYLVANTPKRWSGMLRRNSLARAVRGSNSIEGYNVSVDDAIALAEGEEPLDANRETRLAVQGYQEAMTYVLQLAGDPHFNYSSSLLRALQYMMVKHDLTRNPGRWRPGQIFVRDDERNVTVYEGPDADLVPVLIDELIGTLDKEDSATTPAPVRAAMAHLNLVMIHPFSDGNGRMARCLQTLVLARTGTLAPMFSSIEEYLGRNTREYYDVLAQVGGGLWQPDRDARPWVQFCLKAHYVQATTMLRRAKELDHMWVLMEAEVARHGLPDRTIFALADAAMGLRVRNATYRSIAEISDQLASRDLKQLVDLGLIVAKGERRGRYYERSDRLKLIRSQTRQTKEVTDPFLK